MAVATVYSLRYSEGDRVWQIVESNGSRRVVWTGLDVVEGMARLWALQGHRVQPLDQNISEPPSSLE